MHVGVEPELSLAFTNPLSGARKQIECIRVDGATDEGPGHEEVQFLWTQHHIATEKVVTLVTTRSGSSYLNRVELQNGCLSLGHANTFIPSTIGGSCMDEATGKLDTEKVKRNLNFGLVGALVVKPLYNFTRVNTVLNTWLTVKSCLFS